MTYCYLFFLFIKLTQRVIRTPLAEGEHNRIYSWAPPHESPHSDQMKTDDLLLSVFSFYQINSKGDSNTSLTSCYQLRANSSHSIGLSVHKTTPTTAGDQRSSPTIVGVNFSFHL